MARNEKAVIVPGLAPCPDTAYAAGLNFTAETFDRRVGNGSGTFSTSGQVRGTAVAVREGDVINTLYSYAITAGTAVTAFQMAVYDQSLNLVANTADVKAALGTNVWVPGDLTTSWRATYSGVIYLAQFCTFTTTSPSMAICPTTGSTNFFGAPAGGVGRVSWSQNNATLPSTATPGVSSLSFYILAA